MTHIPRFSDFSARTGFRRAALSALVMVLLAACGGTAGPADTHSNTEPTPEPLELEVTAPDTVEAGNTIELSAVLTGAGSNAATVSWQATDGTFDTETGMNVSWTAPDYPGEQTITAIVTIAETSLPVEHSIEVTAPEDDPGEPGEPVAPGNPDPPGEPEDPEEPEEPLLSVSISGESEVVVGSVIRLTAEVSGEGADVSQVVWSAEPAVDDFIFEPGEYTYWEAPEEPGHVTIRATITVGDESATAEHQVTVIPQPLEVEIEGGDRTTVTGALIQLIADSYGPGATDSDIEWTTTGGTLNRETGPSVSWTAPDTAGGPFTITASLTVDGITVEDRIQVMVTDPPPVVAISGPDRTYWGGEVVFTATVDGQPPEPGVTIIWTSQARRGEFQDNVGESVTWTAPFFDLADQQIRARIEGFPPHSEAVHLISSEFCAGGSISSPTDPCQIHNVQQLQEISATPRNRNGHYMLAGDIDAAETLTWNDGAGFEPIGTVRITPFTGSLDGNGNSISDLYINRPETTDVGLFGYLPEEARITNLRLTDVNITGRTLVGAVAGRVQHPDVEISRVSVSGSVTGAGHSNHSETRAGGLVGLSQGSIIGSSSTAVVTGHGQFVGGLVGTLTSPGSIIDSHSHGSVLGLFNENHGEPNSVPNNVGGIAGSSSGTITDSSSGATVHAEAGDRVGGLVGLMGAATAAITRSYAGSTAAVSGNSAVGGLVGYMSSGQIRQSYSHAGLVHGLGPTSTVAAGGIAGQTESTAMPIDETYSISQVLPLAPWTGGLIGRSHLDNQATRSFWDVDSSGQATSAGGDGAMPRTRAQLTTQSTYSTHGWEFGLLSTWNVLRPVGIGDSVNNLPDLVSNPRSTRSTPPAP